MASRANSKERKGLAQVEWANNSRRRGTACTVLLLVLLALVGTGLLSTSCGGTATPTSAIGTDTTPPPVPEAISPASSAYVSIRTPTFAWSQVTDPTGISYTVEINWNQEFTSPFLEKKGVVNPEYTLQPGESLSDGSFWWRVKAVDGAGNQSLWASSLGITIDTKASESPAIVSPLRGAMVFRSTPKLDWSDVMDPSGIIYVLEIHKSADFASLILKKEGLTTSQYVLSQGEALEPGIYFWRVKTVDGAGNSSGWASASFTLTPALNAPSIPHTTEGRTDCLACHDSLGPWPAPASHKGRGNAVCQICHQPGLEDPPVIAHSLENRLVCDVCHSPKGMAPLPESHRDRTVKMCIMCHSPSQANPPVGPHTTQGREACASCHGPGKLVGQLPSSHAGRTDQMCLGCHTVSTTPPPLIAHSIQEREACTACHAKGALVPLPASHDGRSSKVCAGCHDVSPVTPPSISHSIVGRQQCTQCHAQGKIAPLAVSHQGRTEAMCTVCHEVSKVTPPKIAHSVQGREACTVCHSPNGFATLPASHNGRTQETCQFCHTEFQEVPPLPHPLIGNSDCIRCHAPGKAETELPPSHIGRTQVMCLACHEANL